MVAVTSYNPEALILISAALAGPTIPGPVHKNAVAAAEGVALSVAGMVHRLGVIDTDVTTGGIVRLVVLMQPIPLLSLTWTIQSPESKVAVFTTRGPCVGCVVEV